MNILITGGNFKNKGAALMLISLIHKIRERIPDARIYVSPFLGNEGKLAELGVRYVNYPLFHYGHKRFPLSMRYPFLVRAAMRLKGGSCKGSIALRKIDVVFDISGFAFGDKWGSRPLEDLRSFAGKMKSYGAKFFLLPQAFGPFTKAGMKAHIAKVVSYVDLLIARDKTSHAYVCEALGRNDEKVLLYPDITLAFNPAQGAARTPKERAYCLIVPNERMLDKASEAWQKNYIAAMSRMITQILENSALQVTILIHAQGDSNDAKVGKEIMNAVPLTYGRLSLLVEEDPVKLKSIIRDCDLLIGSRFHALASALSNNVPALATSWLHKYEMLFEDYGCASFSFPEPDDRMYGALAKLLDLDSRTSIVEQLKEVNKRIRKDNDAMWNKIGEYLADD